MVHSQFGEAKRHQLVRVLVHRVLHLIRQQVA